MVAGFSLVLLGLFFGVFLVSVLFWLLRVCFPVISYHNVRIRTSDLFPTEFDFAGFNFWDFCVYVYFYSISY